jgi:hypothetical protein
MPDAPEVGGGLRKASIQLGLAFLSRQTHHA